MSGCGTHHVLLCPSPSTWTACPNAKSPQAVLPHPIGVGQDAEAGGERKSLKTPAPAGAEGGMVARQNPSGQALTPHGPHAVRQR